MSDISQAAFVALSLVDGQSQAQPKTPQDSDLGVLNEAYAVRRAADLNSPGGIKLQEQLRSLRLKDAASVPLRAGKLPLLLLTRWT